MHQRSDQQTRGRTSRRPIEPRILLLALSTGALIVCDLTRLTIPTGVAAVVLAVAAALYLTRIAARFGIYLFIVAELSPLSLNADVLTALIYQTFALLLLTTVIAPFPVVQRARTYARALSLTLLIAAASFIPVGIVVATGTSAVSVVQAASLAVVIIIALGGTLIAIKQNYRTLTEA